MVWRKHVHKQLMALSSAHEYDVRQPVEEQEFTLDTKELRSRWTFQASVLYALTVLTTTGDNDKIWLHLTLELFPFRL